MKGDYLIGRSLGEVDYDNHPDDNMPIHDDAPTHEVVVRYHDSPLRAEVEVISEGTLEEVKAEMYDWHLVYRDIGQVFYRKKALVV